MAKLKPYFLDTKFRGLKIIGIILFVCSGISALLALLILVELFKAEMALMQTVYLTQLATAVITSVALAAAGGIINVLLDIEMNSRETNQLLEQVISNLPENKE